MATIHGGGVWCGGTWVVAQFTFCFYRLKDNHPALVPVGFAANNIGF